MSLLWTARAFNLLVFLPIVISYLKPKADSFATVQEHLAAEMQFDKRLAQASLGLDGTADALVALAPTSSQPTYIGLSVLSSFTSGGNPALHSLGAVCLHACGYGSEVGALFGGMAVLSAVAHIISPYIYAITYASTVAYFPKAIFVLASALLTTVVLLLSGIKSRPEEIIIREQLTITDDGAPAEFESALLVLGDYKVLRQILDKHWTQRDGRGRLATLVTGQPGTGKRTFLLDLLIRRPQRKGTHGCLPIKEMLDAHRHRNNPSCGYAAFVILVSSAAPTTWEKWVEALTLIAELPTVLGIGAIAKQAMLDSSRTWALVKKWEPSTRTVIRILGDPYPKLWESEFADEACASSERICKSPLGLSVLLGGLHALHVASSVLVFCPNRITLSDNSMHSRSGIIVIPTQYLGSIFKACLEQMKNAESLKFFFMFGARICI
ncbi:hypothetical protein DXG03_004723 [Asterophora parasitica]|uniref:Uncharacterized protein n=1 Tax=Asterophora parasitica TaxID=117018 RepID=A0A9P7GAF2_9AGAR|nr:hypothetical protein DXG03_004723 [Asterophora parasitica]